MTRFAVSLPLSSLLRSDFTFDRLLLAKKRTNLLCSIRLVLSFSFVAFEVFELVGNLSSEACLLVSFYFYRCHYLLVVSSIRFFPLIILRTLDLQFIIELLWFAWIDWFMCECMFLAWLLLYLNHNHSIVVFFTSLWRTRCWHTRCFITIKLQWKFRFYSPFFDNDPKQRCCKWFCIFVYVLFDFVLELTTNCRNKTIQHSTPAEEGERT